MKFERKEINIIKSLQLYYIWFYMKIKVSDYIADFLVKNKINQLFTVVGGGSMHLNDSFGHKENLNVIYHHHEQAAAIAAEAYARYKNLPAAICVTSGPGATNAITGCLCAYMGSIPMLIFSGQVRYPLTVRAQKLNLRTNGEQEYDICKSVESMTKYSVMIDNPYDIKYHLDKALFLAKNGRPGPTWLDIPLDVQGAMIETDDLKEFIPNLDFYNQLKQIKTDTIELIYDKLMKSKRPVICVGLGVRLANACPDLLILAETLNIPIITHMTTLDVVPNDHSLYAGRSGTTGDRSGNFVIQNSDFLISIGSRLSYKQTGYNHASWAKNAFKIMVDIDEEELKRKYLNIDLAIRCDAKTFIKSMLKFYQNNENIHLNNYDSWISQCKKWQLKYPVVTPDLYNTIDGKASIYVFYKVLSKLVPENGIYVTTSGNSRVVARQVLEIKKNQRVITNHSTSPMGYCLPAAIGTCVSSNKKNTILITGEGGFQMNIQELQTIKHNNLPIKIFVINNEGYHSIRITQNNFFADHTHIGIGNESGDLSFPDIKKIANAYDFPYMEVSNNSDLEEVISNFLNIDGYALCQVYVTKTQFTSPKVASRRLKNGSFQSAELEDMYPFLSKDELEENMLD